MEYGCAPLPSFASLATEGCSAPVCRCSCFALCVPCMLVHVEGAESHALLVRERRRANHPMYSASNSSPRMIEPRGAVVGRRRRAEPEPEKRGRHAGSAPEQRRSCLRPSGDPSTRTRVSRSSSDGPGRRERLAVKARVSAGRSVLLYVRTCGRDPQRRPRGAQQPGSPVPVVASPESAILAALEASPFGSLPLSPFRLPQPWPCPRRRRSASARRATLRRCLSPASPTRAAPLRQSRAAY